MVNVNVGKCCTCYVVNERASDLAPPWSCRYFVSCEHNRRSSAFHTQDLLVHPPPLKVQGSMMKGGTALWPFCVNAWCIYCLVLHFIHFLNNQILSVHTSWVSTVYFSCKCSSLLRWFCKSIMFINKAKQVFQVFVVVGMTSLFRIICTESGFTLCRCLYWISIEV